MASATWFLMCEFSFKACISLCFYTRILNAILKIKKYLCRTILCSFSVQFERRTPELVLVLCSAGVGRTGTYICVDTLLHHIVDHDTIDIFGLVLNLRRFRTNIVQTEASCAAKFSILSSLERKISSFSVVFFPVCFFVSVLLFFPTCKKNNNNNNYVSPFRISTSTYTSVWKMPWVEASLWNLQLIKKTISQVWPKHKGTSGINPSYLN